MRRRYKRELYADRVARIKELMPDCCIGVDAIVGFPGETREDFLETYQFLNGLDISYLHVFTYSERENTSLHRWRAPYRAHNAVSAARCCISFRKRSGVRFTKRSWARKATCYSKATSKKAICTDSAVIT